MSSDLPPSDSPNASLDTLTKLHECGLATYLAKEKSALEANLRRRSPREWGLD